MGSYNSTNSLGKSGLSPDGTYLVGVLPTDSGKLNVKKLCADTESQEISSAYLKR
jgi:hypothetical protein